MGGERNGALVGLKNGCFLMFLDFFFGVLKVFLALVSFFLWCSSFCGGFSVYLVALFFGGLVPGLCLVEVFAWGAGED